MYSDLVLKLMYLPQHCDKRNSPEIFQKQVIVKQFQVTKWVKKEQLLLFICIDNSFLFGVFGTWKMEADN